MAMVGYATNANDDISWNQTTVCEALHLQGAIIRTQTNQCFNCARYCSALQGMIGHTESGQNPI